MNQTIKAQLNICWKLSDELDFISSYYSIEKFSIAKYNEELKKQLICFADKCNDTNEDLSLITSIKEAAKDLIFEIHQQLDQTDPSKQNILECLSNLESQIATLDNEAKNKFKSQLANARNIALQIAACKNTEANLQFKLQSLSKQKPTLSSSLTYFFQGIIASRKAQHESKLNQTKLQVATHTHNLMRLLLNIYHMHRNHVELQANISDEKFRTNSQDLALASDEKRKPGLRLSPSALGFVKA
jgi:hypothetical protein